MRKLHSKQNPHSTVLLLISLSSSAPPIACTTFSSPCTSSAATLLPRPASKWCPPTSTPLFSIARRDWALIYPLRFASAEFSSSRTCLAAGSDEREVLSCASSSRRAGSWAMAYWRFCDRGCVVVEVWGEVVRKLKGEGDAAAAAAAAAASCCDDCDGCPPTRDCNFAITAWLRASSALSMAFNFAVSWTLRLCDNSSSGVRVDALLSSSRFL